MECIDAHSHLQFPDYDADRAAVIARMTHQGVKTVTVGVDYATSRAAIALAEQYPEHMRATVGVHPTDDELAGTDWAALRTLAASPMAVAIGECGLDYFRLQSAHRAANAALQKEAFMKHIALAHETHKALMVHCRPAKGSDDAYEDAAEIVRANARTLAAVIMHFFVGSPAMARTLLDIGCYFTFGGALTFSNDYHESVRAIPLERILLETDAPFVAPAPYRGRRNEPAYVAEVARRIAEIKNISTAEVAHATTATARRIFHWTDS